jgi:cellobiose phosphorylase
VHDIATTVTYFVPVADPCELWLLKIANRGQTARRLQVFSYLEWLLGAAPDWHREFHSVFIETRFNAEHGALLARKVLWDLPGQSGPHWNRDWPYVAFHSASPRPAGFEGYKLAFLGRHGRPGDPQAVRAGGLQGTSGRWGDAIASLQVEVEVRPGAETELVFALGAAHDEARALDVVQKYRSVEAAQQALAETRRFWQGLTAGLTIETPDDALNVMGNTWLKYQAIAGRMFGRTAYYQTGGAYGFRDQLQDSLTWLLLGQPERTLAQIRLHAAHQYQRRHRPALVASAGRNGPALELQRRPAVAALRGPPLHRGDRRFRLPREEIPFYDEGSASLLEHCLAAFEVALGRRSGAACRSSWKATGTTG